MLTTMRRFAKGFVAKALMALLVISFGVWGIGDIFRSHASGSLASVGREHVSAQEFVNQRAAIRQAMASLNISGMDSMAMDNEILRRLIQTRLVRLWLKDAGLSVNRDLLATTIQQDGQFHDITGKFDPKMFKANLAARQLSESVYLLQLKDEIAGKTLQTSLTTDDLAISPALEKMALAAQTQTRDVLLLSVPLPSINPASVTDVQAKAFYDAHTTLYLEPERRTLEYVTLDKDDITAVIDASISEAALKERYESNPKIAASFEAARPELLKQMRSEARDHVLQTVSTQMEDAMAGGSSMGEALAKAGVKSQSKLLTRITANQIAATTDALLSSVVNKGFQLSDGETSSLQATKDGRYFMVGVKEILPAAPKNFAVVKDAVRAQVAKEQAAATQREVILKAKEALDHDSAAVEKTVQSLHLSTRMVKALSRPHPSTDGKAMADSGVLPASLAQAVFERGVHEVAGPALMPDGSAALAVIQAQHQPATSLSEKEIARIRKEYQASLGNEAVGAALNALVAEYPVNVNQELLQQLTQNTPQ